MSFQIPTELIEKANNIEDEENEVFTQKPAIYHEKTLAKVSETNKIIPVEMLTFIFYIDENDKEVIDKNGKKYLKKRIKRYGLTYDNPEYDLWAIIKEDLPGVTLNYECLKENKNG